MPRSWPVQFLYESEDAAKLDLIRTESFSAPDANRALEAARRYARACPTLVAGANLLIVDDETVGVYEEATL